MMREIIDAAALCPPSGLSPGGRAAQESSCPMRPQLTGPPGTRGVELTLVCKLENWLVSYFVGYCNGPGAYPTVV